MPTLALSMIVKNAERDLAECLGSVRGIVDEIVVADTGSTDSTIEIAQQAHARVISIPWENDFSKARNLSLAEVRSDWVLALDADERLDPAAGGALPSLLGNKDVDGYQVTLRNYVPSLSKTIWDRSARPNDSLYAPAREYPAYVDHENVRLFRRSPDIYFTGRVHETVGWRILSCHRKIASSNLILHHLGMFRDPQERARKILLYREMGKLKVADMPENSQAHFELGLSELENFGNLREALASIERACELDRGFGVAWFFAGVCRFRLGEFSRALDCFRRAESSGHATPLVAEMAGDSHYNLREYDAAAAAYRRGLKRAPDNASLESKLGLAGARAGNTSAGLRRLRRAIEWQPANPDLYDRLIMVEVWLKHPTQAAEAAEKQLAATPSRAETFLRAASIFAQLKDWQRAAEILRDGCQAFPDSELLRANLSKVETLSAPSRDVVAVRVNK
jgi:tetratricopeptide (TPR) repeat protein